MLSTQLIISVRRTGNSFYDLIILRKSQLYFDLKYELEKQHFIQFILHFNSNILSLKWNKIQDHLQMKVNLIELNWTMCLKKIIYKSLDLDQKIELTIILNKFTAFYVSLSVYEIGIFSKSFFSLKFVIFFECIRFRERETEIFSKHFWFVSFGLTRMHPSFFQTKFRLGTLA